ncbi:MAG: bifunctional UDP-N-acetylglucosamine diphosphorylase/glucosamine-1-phosphate N-acetyltransferase GlmU [Gammaproteobacteria bacterium]|nr:bifunctional UDP-N-acetylglucosamine diphosphorylase/glucosamine-1-phosphate N-acetyltransferase GlmU [Gammaproteobacteria bacterium]
MPLSVVVLAAGQGTRMNSDVPKVLHEIGGAPMLSHVIRAAEALEAQDVTVVYGHGGEQVQSALSDHKISWVEQTEQLGTGHAVAQAMPKVPDNHTTLLLYGDVPLITADTLGKLVAAAGDNALALLTAVVDNPMGYGRIVRDSSGKVQSIVEQKDASEEQLLINEVNTGMLAVRSNELRQWINRLDNSNAQGEFYLTDIVGFAVEDGISINITHPASTVETEGVNNKRQLAELERAYQLRLAYEYMDNGLTLRDPNRFDVRGNLTFGKDVTIDTNVLIEGNVVLGDCVNVGPNVLLKNITIGNETHIHANSVLEKSIIGKNCVIGPFARIRPETELADQVKVGNFVEIKKSTVAAGSKINHLSYIGDTTMGSQVNIGAGTITCNYDGANKHQTIIGNNVFIGSSSQLIAPITVGDGATIGAGSTITRNVPSDELTLTRSRQVTKEGWKRPEKKK